MTEKAKRWDHRKQKGPLPKPSAEEIENVGRLVRNPEDFEMQHPDSIYDPRILRDGTPSQALRSTNPDRYKLRVFSFVVDGWCSVPGRSHEYRGRPCGFPHPVRVGIILPERHGKQSSSWVQIRWLFGWDPAIQDLKPLRSLNAFTYMNEIPRETRRLLWLRPRCRVWTPETHARCLKPTRRAVQCIMNIWRLRECGTLCLLPREVLFIIFGLL